MEIGEGETEGGSRLIYNTIYILQHRGLSSSSYLVGGI